MFICVHLRLKPLPNVRIGIYYSDDRAIGWRFVAFKWKRRFLSAAPKDEFAFAGSDSIKGDHRASLCFQIRIKRLHKQELSAVQAFVLYRRNDGADNACDLHPYLRDPNDLCGFS